VTAGAGIALLPRAVADDDPALVRVATRSEPEARVIWSGVHRDLVANARIRAVVTWLSEVAASLKKTAAATSRTARATG
jgi:DNA-binding transcriptional LysR family regulator